MSGLGGYDAVLSLGGGNEAADFITLPSAAAAWPLGARAASAMPVIGFSAAGHGYRASCAAFRQGLARPVILMGGTSAIEYRWAEGQIDRLPELAADLVAVKSRRFLRQAGGQIAAKAATSTIPVVSPLAAIRLSLGLVASMNRPGGNATAVTVLTAESGQSDWNCYATCCLR